jgi:hypothetical protein
MSWIESSISLSLLITLRPSAENASLSAICGVLDAPHVGKAAVELTHDTRGIDDDDGVRGRLEGGGVGGEGVLQIRVGWRTGRLSDGSADPDRMAEPAGLVYERGDRGVFFVDLAGPGLILERRPL